MKIQFRHKGNSLGTRFMAKDFRRKIENGLLNNEFITFDFSNVDVISHSFADECFGKLLLFTSLPELQSKTTFKNTNPEVKKMIAFVLKERLLQTEYA